MTEGSLESHHAGQYAGDGEISQVGGGETCHIGGGDIRDVGG